MVLSGHSLVSLAVLGLSLLPLASQAASLLVNNHSFETPATANSTFVTSPTAGPSGWSVYDTATAGVNRAFGVLNPNGTTLYIDPVPHGTNNVGVVFLMNSSSLGTGKEAGLQQTLSSTLQLSTQYTLVVEVGNIRNDAAFPHNQFNFTGFPGYRIDLMAGSNVIASDNNTLAPGEGRFLTSTVQFTTGASHAYAGQALGIRLVNLDTLNAPGIEVNFDNVRLDAVTIPEPKTQVALFVGGLALLAGTRLFRQRA